MDVSQILCLVKFFWWIMIPNVVKYVKPKKKKMVLQMILGLLFVYHFKKAF